MANATYFVQGCPTCGRQLQIRVEYLGRKVACQHCQGKFVAVDPASTRADDVDQSQDLLRRAEELLNSVAQAQMPLAPAEAIARPAVRQ